MDSCPSDDGSCTRFVRFMGFMNLEIKSKSLLQEEWPRRATEMNAVYLDATFVVILTYSHEVRTGGCNADERTPGAVT